MASVITAVTLTAPHAWLWNVDTFSDFTFILRSGAETRTETLSESSSSPLNKKLRRSCNCSHPSLESAPQTDETIESPSVGTGSSSRAATAAAGSLPGTVKVSSSQPAENCTFNLHAAVLSSASGYFRALLTTHMSGWCPDCKVATHVLEGRELEAAPHVLKYIYTHQLPTGNGVVADGMLQMWMIKVADCWDVPTCVTACQQALCSLSIAAFPINGMFSLPSTFCLAATMEPVMVAARAHLLHRFGNALNVCMSPKKLQRLTQLPHSGMLHLLRSDSLATDNEATVLLLLRAWHQRNRFICSVSMLAELKEAVRYSLIPRAYLGTALPQMPDLCVTLAQERELWMMNATRGHYPDDAWLRLGRSCPRGWFLRPRPSANDPALGEPPGTFTVTLDVPAARLRACGAGATVQEGGGLVERFLSLPVIGCGYSWSLSMLSHASGADFTIELQVELPVIPSVIKAPAKAAAVTVECAVTIQTDSLTENGSVEHLFSRQNILFSGSIVLCRVLPGPAKMFLDGQKHLFATISMLYQ